MSDRRQRRSRREILNWLKSKGPQDATALADRLGVSAMAVRQHLYTLEADGLVEFLLERRPRGRPAKLWRLTAKAAPFFPDGHSELTVDLLSGLREAFGDDGLARLVAGRSDRQARVYRERMPKKASLRRQLQSLARVRTEEGYMAEVVAEPDGSLLFVENHCPICDAAQACMGLCSGELDVFRQVLGRGVEIDREEHMLDGSRRCTYRVRTKAEPKPR